MTTGGIRPLTSEDRLVPFDRFGPHAIVMRDIADGRLYMQMTPPGDIKVTPWNCICHPNLHYKRPHFTCLAFCRIKRVAEGKLPAMIPVNQYRMYIHLGRAHAHVKDWLLRKFIIPIAEWLAN